MIQYSVPLEKVGKLDLEVGVDHAHRDMTDSTLGRAGKAKIQTTVLPGLGLAAALLDMMAHTTSEPAESLAIISDPIDDIPHPDVLRSADCQVAVGRAVDREPAQDALEDRLG